MPGRKKGFLLFSCGSGFIRLKKLSYCAHGAAETEPPAAALFTPPRFSTPQHQNLIRGIASKQTFINVALAEPSAEALGARAQFTQEVT